MTMHMLNTKAEQALLQMFDTYSKSFPGGAVVDAVRRSAVGAFASKGLPGRRLEEWKYTDLRSAFKETFPLAVSEPALSRLPLHKETLHLPNNIAQKFQKKLMCFLDGRGHQYESSSAAVIEHPTFFSQFSGDPPSWICELLEDSTLTVSSDYLLNSAFFTDGAVIDIPSGTISDQPYCIFAGTKSPNSKSFSALRHFIRVGSGAKICLLEFDNTGGAKPHQTSHLTQLQLESGSEMIHVKIVLGATGSFHLGHWQVALGENAIYKPFHLMLGDGLVRSSLNVTFSGEGSLLDYGGASLVNGTGHIDNTLLIDHQVPRCTSRELFKAVLDGESRAIFQGKVIVRPNAQKTDGKQMAQALILSPNAEFDSKPELEIYADDVACGHGSTSAEIDPDLLFYCRSRGIPLEIARSLLIESFIGEVIDKIENVELKEIASELVQASLSEAF